MNKQKGIEKSKKSNICINKAKNYLLLIGIQQYNDSTIRKLENPISDIDRIERVLVHDYDFQLYSKLSNEEATRSAIINIIEEMESVLTENDNLIFFFSGHGYRKRKSGFILPYDSKSHSSENYITFKELETRLDEIPMRHFLFIIDCCYAGSALKEMKNKSEFNKPSRCILAACSADETAEDGFIGKNSPFIATLAEVLEQNMEYELGVKTLYVKLRDLMDYRGIQQVPIEGAWRMDSNKGGEFFFTKYIIGIKEPIIPTHKIEIKQIVTAENEIENMNFEYSKLKYIKKEQPLVALLNKYPNLDDFYKYEIKAKIDRLRQAKKKRDKYENYIFQEQNYLIEKANTVKELIFILSADDLNPKIKENIHKKIDKIQKIDKQEIFCTSINLLS